MNYDVIVIGSGPGGYVAAIRCAQLGMKTGIIEKYATLGGTCLNVGCIPSKAMLDSSEHFYNATHHFNEHGILTGTLQVDLSRMIERKNGVVKANVDGINYLMKKNKIDVHQGTGSFVNSKQVKVSKENGEEIILESKNIIIATGSKPSVLPGIQIDKKRIITSTEALQMTEIPNELVVIGGGVIGLELGSVYARMGSKVKVIEYTQSLIPTMDSDLGKELQKSLKGLGFEFFFGHKVTSAVTKGKKAEIKALDKDGKEVSFNADYCLVSVGRSPFTRGLQLENAGLSTDERGRIPVNDHLQTQVTNIFAIGDVVRGAMLAHKAEEEGMFVAEFIAGQKPHINYRLIPNVVYTWPEVAAVGDTEEELKKQGRKYKKGSFPFKANGRARASMDLDGFIKVLADTETDEILGVHMIGARVADIIAEATVAMEFRAAAEDVARTCHPHPTFTEVFKEACLMATDNRPIHI